MSKKMPEKEKEVKRTPTSLNVDVDLWRQAKIEAINRGVTVTELFEDALRKELSGKLKGGKL